MYHLHNMYDSHACVVNTHPPPTHTHTVKPYDPKSKVTLQALYKLQAGAAIPVLTELESKFCESEKEPMFMSSVLSSMVLITQLLIYTLTVGWKTVRAYHQLGKIFW